jgi:hypothetical protein
MLGLFGKEPVGPVAAGERRVHPAESVRFAVTHLVVDVSGHHGGRKECGTTFCVAWPPGAPDVRKAVYLVAARHVVRSKHNRGALYVRVNRVGGDYDDIPTSRDEWAVHPSTDVAVLRLTRQAHFELDGLWPELLTSQPNVEVGDHAFFVGLFIQSPGIRRAEPLARFGRVSRTLEPNVRVNIQLEDESKIDVDAHLVEGQSWKGQSGSPVFVYRPQGYFPGTEWSTELRGPWLLGLTHGASLMPQGIKAEPPHPLLKGVTLYANSGIAVVIPTAKIIETLELPAVRAERKKFLSGAEGE